MAKQVLVIHGGDAFDSYEEYLADLRAKTVDLERAKIKGWKANLPDALGDGFEVIAPSMPNKQNAKYLEWKIWFEKHLPFLRDGVILVGHSLGGIFLAKYLSEETVPVRVRATLLVAAPFSTASFRPFADFQLSADLSGLARQGGELIAYHSADDRVVPFSDADEYARAVHGLALKALDGRGHFNQDRFPEIEEDIKRLAV